MNCKGQGRGEPPDERRIKKQVNIPHLFPHLFPFIPSNKKQRHQSQRFIIREANTKAVRAPEWLAILWRYPKRAAVAVA